VEDKLVKLRFFYQACDAQAIFWRVLEWTIPGQTSDFNLSSLPASFGALSSGQSVSDHSPPPCVRVITAPVCLDGMVLRHRDTQAYTFRSYRNILFATFLYSGHVHCLVNVFQWSGNSQPIRV
jgi:hypothetical protein